MIIDIFSIPLINDKSERIFLEIRRTISWDRGQIELKIIEMREYLKHWKKSGILNAFLESC
jgi:hypothetical protein